MAKINRSFNNNIFYSLFFNKFYFNKKFNQNIIKKGGRVAL